MQLPLFERNKMEPILKRELDKAIRVLDLIKCEYAIIDPDGQKYGNLEVAEKKIGKSRLEFPRGVVKEHIEPFIKDLALGEFATVPVDKYGAERVQSAILNYMRAHRGENSATTSKSKDDLTILVWRKL